GVLALEMNADRYNPSEWTHVCTDGSPERGVKNEGGIRCSRRSRTPARKCSATGRGRKDHVATDRGEEGNKAVHADRERAAAETYKEKNRAVKKRRLWDTEVKGLFTFELSNTSTSWRTHPDIEKEVSTIGLAAQAFNRLQNVWKSSALQTSTKLKIYWSNVR
ncbi:hypothetical protein BaRGS_00015364, partial [Batillaria attramentaria]